VKAAHLLKLPALPGDTYSVIRPATSVIAVYLEGLRDAANDAEPAALANAIRRDLGDRPGDLALAQMALWTVWRNRRAHDGSLLRAYVDVGRVSGALAQEAERIRTRKLDEAERALWPALFVRLVRLGETGGVLRRVAGLDEFDGARRALADKLASDDYGRLLLVGEALQAANARIEVCHEALITQWPWLQNALNAAAADLRALGRLTDRAARWHSARPAELHKHLATGAERELFADLRERRDGWLSETERDFVAASEATFACEEKLKRDAEKNRLLMMDSANRLQEEAFGTLDRALLKLLDGLARRDSSRTAERNLKIGTVLIREYQGRRHTITVAPKGYAWEGNPISACRRSPSFPRRSARVHRIAPRHIGETDCVADHIGFEVRRETGGKSPTR
jgi:Protein of unknown function (DUF2924)